MVSLTIRGPLARSTNQIHTKHIRATQKRTFLRHALIIVRHDHRHCRRQRPLHSVVHFKYRGGKNTYSAFSALFPRATRFSLAGHNRPDRCCARTSDCIIRVRNFTPETLTRCLPSVNRGCTLASMATCTTKVTAWLIADAIKATKESIANIV